MKLFLAYTAIASVATIAAATSCTSGVALAWPYTRDDSTDGTTCNGSIGCEAIVAEGQCNSLSLIDDTDTTCVEALKKRKRAVDLDCTSSEKCFFFLDDSLLCLNQASGAYHDDVGGSGNAISGVYTAPDGEVQTVTGVSRVSAEPSTTTSSTATAASDSESTRASSASTTVSSSGQTTTGTGTAVTVSSSSASSRSSSASQSLAAAQSSRASQSASAAAETGAAAPRVAGRSVVLVAFAMPLVLAVG